jgi:peptidoglycan/LPS O-acetylase OafA/YrhL
VCATFSYYVVEKPFVRWGHKLARASAARNGFSRGAVDPPPVPLNLPMLD